MATFSATNATGPIRLDTFNIASLLVGSTITNSATTFTRGADADNATTFSGAGFTYSGGLFNGGTINSIGSVGGGQTQYTIGGLSLPVAQFRAFVNAGNSQGFLGAVFAGNDTLTGSAFDDYLSGFAGNDSTDGGTGNDTLDGGKGIDTLNGGDGNDLYFVDNAKDIILADSAGIDSVQSSVSLTLGGTLEHLFLTGTGALNGTGNDSANQIAGNAGANKLLGLIGNDLLDGAGGNDMLDGGTGDDTMGGGAGNDTYFVDSASDQVIESIAGKAGGIDIVFSSADITLGANVENLTLTGANSITAIGNDLNNVILAKNANPDPGQNVITGGGGNDTIVGGTGKDIIDGELGADAMTGGAGDDFYFVDDKGDKVTESIGGGDDRVIYQGSTGYTLGANLETLTLTSSIGATFGIGNNLDNTIIANGEANMLDGKTGADLLIGQGGNDIYVVDNALDVVDEFSGALGGVDTVRSSVDFNLNDNGTTVLGEVENLVLLGKALTGTGNGLGNQITGNAGKNTLLGLSGDDTLDGGAGNDTLSGGDGNDLYIVDSKLDVTKETGADTGDTISSSKISLDLAAYANIEHITLLGTAALTGTGDGGNNVITGNAGANKLFGLGGADSLAGGIGNDTLDGGTDNDVLAGGAGNDTYFVDSYVNSFTGDLVDESGGSGIDTVISSAAIFSLDQRSLGEVENLTLAAAAGGAFGEGTGLANLLIGNGSNNILAGLAGDDTIDGGAGDDTLQGGAGNDTINVSAGNDIVDYRNTTDGRDLILGFDGNPVGGQDSLNLDRLFDSLPVQTADRASRVMIVDHGATVDVRVDIDGNLANGYEQTVATIQTTDAVSIGQDVLVGTL